MRDISKVRNNMEPEQGMSVVLFIAGLVLISVGVIEAAVFKDLFATVMGVVCGYGSILAAILIDRK